VNGEIADVFVPDAVVPAALASDEFVEDVTADGSSALVANRGGGRSLQAARNVVKIHVAQKQLLWGARMLCKFNVWW
jgi:hypothetical protein